MGLAVSTASDRAVRGGFPAAKWNQEPERGNVHRAHRVAHAARPIVAELGLSQQHRMVVQMNTPAMDMRDYGTALTRETADTPTSGAAKRTLNGLWSAFFKPAGTLPAAYEPQGGSAPLNIVVIGAGVAGSAAYRRLVGLEAGHRVALLEKRAAPPSRENLVTVNAEARNVINELSGGVAFRLLQTDGNIG